MEEKSASYIQAYTVHGILAPQNQKKKGYHVLGYNLCL